jgi:hypothetical protein
MTGISISRPLELESKGSKESSIETLGKVDAMYRQIEGRQSQSGVTLTCVVVDYLAKAA